jgi:hypothetical protein
MTSTDIAIPDDNDLMIGLDDFDESDIVLPSIKIDHKEGVFVDGLSGEKFPVLDCVVLGLVKGRIMWAAEVKDDEPPLCQSLNFTDGRPGEKFPWPKSGFKRDGTGAEGEQQQVVSCADCPLKEWGSHPTRDVPWCSEQHTYVLGLPSKDGTSYAPAVITFRSSGIKPSKAYLSGYMRAKSPTFVNTTRITLEQLKRGAVDYCVPKFEKGAPVDESFFASFASQFRTTRAFLHTPRTLEASGSESEGASPSASSESTTTRSVPDDEMPF